MGRGREGSCRDTVDGEEGSGVERGKLMAV